MSDEWRHYIGGLPDAHLRADVTAHRAVVGPTEPEPDSDGQPEVPRWFIVAFAIACLCCGVTAVAGVVAAIVGWFS